MARDIKFVPSIRTGNYLHEAIYRINVGYNLTEEIAFSSFREALLLKNPEERGIFMGILLNSVMARGPSIEEAVGFIRAAFLFDNFDPTKLDGLKLKGKVIGIGGSGKKGIKSMNISSVAAIVASSLGINIAKPCSDSTSSLTGSADFIENLGANININAKEMTAILKETGLGFFKIESQIPRFNSLYGGKFYAPHILSLGLAGMILPFKPDSMLYGLAHPSVELSAKVFRRFGYKNVMVVTTTDDGVHFLDEFGTFGTTSIIGIRDGKLGKLVSIQTSDILNFPNYTRESIKPGFNKEDNIRLAVQVLSGKGEAAREDIVCINAATLLYLAGKAEDLKEGYIYAKQAIKKGYPIEKLKDFIRATSGNIKFFYKYL